MEHSFHLILTGGTIDSYYDGIKDTAVTNRESVIPEFLLSLKLYDRFEVTPICMKDSRSIAPVDRKKILRSIDRRFSF